MQSQKGNVFALCDFIAADKDVMIVDLTMGEKWNPHRQQHEIRRLVKSSQRKNALLKTDVLENDQVCQKILLLRMRIYWQANYLCHWIQMIRVLHMLRSTVLQITFIH